MNKVIPMIALAVLAACNRTLPCEDCEEAEAEEADSDPPTDLPCGGADLQTDDENCGECGNVCPLSPASLSGTEWNAGGCQDGVCGPTWGSCGAGWETCDEYCALGGVECVDGGCAGVSGLRFAFYGFEGCVPPLEDLSPIEGCDTVIDYDSGDPGLFVEVRCCCALPGG